MMRMGGIWNTRACTHTASSYRRYRVAVTPDSKLVTTEYTGGHRGDMGLSRAAPFSSPLNPYPTVYKSSLVSPSIKIILSDTVVWVWDLIPSYSPTRTPVSEKHARY